MRSSPRRRSLLAALVVLGWCLACGAGQSEGLEVEMPDFAAPRQVVVVAGDSLSLIAKREGCTAADIRSWNGLESDVIEPEQILLVWATDNEKAKPKDGSDFVRTASNKPVPARKAPAKKSGGWNPLRALVGSDEPVEEEEVVETAAVGTDDEAPEIQRPLLVRGAGILGVDLGGDDTDLAASAANMKNRSGSMDGSGLKARGGGLDGGGEADSFDVEARQPGTRGGVQIPNTPVKAPRLSKPSRKTCLRAPTEADLKGDHDTVRSVGLDEAQIRTGMSKVVRASPVCFPSGTSGTYSLVVELMVGCDGVVDSVRTISPGVVPSHVTKCIETTMSYAGFAPHGTPNGVAFQFPLEYSF